MAGESKLDGVTAWIDRMPGSEPKLIVLATVTAPTAGWSFALERARPQGINPAVLMLNLTAQKPEGPAADVVTISEVRYVEQPPQVDYTDVTILFDGPGMTTPVGTTS